VIGGWFLTALCAFTLTALIALALFYGGMVTAAILIGVVLVFLIKTNFFSKHKDDDITPESGRVDKVTICNSVNSSVMLYFDSILVLYKEALTEFLDDNLTALRKTRNQVIQLHEEIVSKRAEYYRFAYEGDEDKVDNDAKYYYYRVLTNLKEVGHGLRNVVGVSYNHISNSHSVYRSTLRDNLFIMMTDLEDLRNFLNEYAHSPLDRGEVVSKRTEQSITLLNSLQHQMLMRIDKHNLSLRSSELYLNYLQFSRDIINRFSLVALLQHELNEKCRG
jgi:hypothetical protein